MAGTPLDFKSQQTAYMDYLPSPPPSSSSSSSPPLSPMMSRQSKVVSQRQYREKEGECFNALRDVIHKLTGEAPQTRYEILREAIGLLSTAPELRKSSKNGVAHPTAPLETLIGLNDVALAQTGYPLQPSSWPQNWQSTVEPAVQTAYYHSNSYGQQYHPMPDTDPALNQAGSRGYGGEWFSGSDFGFD